MYCPKCKCEFIGWERKCPIDGTRLTKINPVFNKQPLQQIPYDTIIDLIRKNNGSYEIELFTTEVDRERKASIPFRGYGFAWAKKMNGSFNDVTVELYIKEIGKDKENGFPYQGYGFAC